jgi:glycosyltransferase involved in cell wall biosynthesis
MPQALTVSLVVPLYNEEDNVAPLVARVHEALAQARWSWELILVDDGSRDASARRAREASAAHGAHVRLVQLARNFGQTAAMQAGIDAARGELIATLDGDLQNDPADIPAMVDKLLADDLDLLQGWRRERKDDALTRNLPSWIANRLIARVTGVALHDNGCSLKVYRAAVLKQIALYGEMHRFIPAWIATVTPPSRIGEMVVRHHPRHAGTSKYGIMRTFRVLLDLLAILFFMRYQAKPGHFFGAIGLVLGALGGAALAWLGFVKLAFGEDIGTRPLLMIGVMCVLMGMQFLTTGVLAELLSRAYFQASNTRHYVLRVADAATAWREPGA